MGFCCGGKEEQAENEFVEEGILKSNKPIPNEDELIKLIKENNGKIGSSEDEKDYQEIKEPLDNMEIKPEN